MNFDVFKEFANEWYSVMQRLEESLSEANHRSLGGFKTEDQRFAFSQRELIRDMLSFFDELQDNVNDRIREFETTIEEQQFQIDDSNSKLAEISDHIKDLRRLRTIENIINGE